MVAGLSCAAFGFVQLPIELGKSGKSGKSDRSDRSDKSDWSDLSDLNGADACAALLKVNAEMFVAAPARDRESIETFEALAPDEGHEAKRRRETVLRDPTGLPRPHPSVARRRTTSMCRCLRTRA